jgi:cytochrome c oxidase assembly factor CtaG/ferredoxin
VSPTLEACLRSWTYNPWLIGALLITASIYLRGWLVLRRRWDGGHLAAFYGGLAMIYLALASPLEPFSALLLQVHMLQHLLLTMVAPPLLWLGAPLLPLLRGLPRPIRVFWAGPFLAWDALRRLVVRLTHPLTAIILFVAATWLWHAPPIYDLALRSDDWHYLQHVCFFGAGLLFWYPVVRPYPARPRWSLWLLLPVLLLADLSNTALSALLTFSDRLLYPYYGEVPRLGGLAALDDQATAGVIMWVPGSLAFLLPLFWIGIRALYGAPAQSRIGQLGETPARSSCPASAIEMPAASLNHQRLPLPVLRPGSRRKPEPRPQWDLLRVRWLGSFLKWPHSRLALQLPVLLVAVAVIYDGLTGPRIGPMNLAGVLPWIHWRGLVMIGLLLLGNLFCMACPFMLPRTLARRFLSPGLRWPVWLRNKWLAVTLIIVFFWAYDAFALWDSPCLTAWIGVGYFAAALIIDSLFRGAVFCKYVCPIGQFNFVQSLVSPFEVKARSTAVCQSCRSKDCIRFGSTANNASSTHSRGCELKLFMPLKSGNMDCTFCLDCVHACPHDNIGIVRTSPAKGLATDPRRSGVGRIGKRLDLAALTVVLVFAGFANAAGMVEPVATWQERLQKLLGQTTPFWIVSVYYSLVLVWGPMLAVGFVAAWSRRWAGSSATTLQVATRYAYSLVPLGFAMWLCHCLFHLLTSYDAAASPILRLAARWGWGSGELDWTSSCCRPVAPWLPRVEILCLDIGMLMSLYVGYRIALATSKGVPALKGLAPWAMLTCLLFALGIWIVLQPMQMRGTMQMAG